MKQILQDMVKSLVDNSDEVKVQEAAGQETVIFEISVARDDVGKVIGRQGRTAAAIRTIMGALGAKNKKRVSVEILE